MRIWDIPAFASGPVASANFGGLGKRWRDLVPCWMIEDALLSFSSITAPGKEFEFPPGEPRVMLKFVCAIDS